MDFKNSWKDLKANYQIGQTVRGEILHKLPFGFFLRLELGGIGLVLIPFIHDDPQKGDMMWQKAQVGDVFNGVVILLDEKAEKVQISSKPSDFQRFGSL